MVFFPFVAVAAATLVSATSLAEVCTIAYVTQSLPAAGFVPGISIIEDSVTANAVGSFNVNASEGLVGATAVSVCNVTLAYTHTGKTGQTNLWFWLPAPSNYKGRFLATGGGGFAITSGQSALAAGIPYGAVTGTTDGGLGGWKGQLPQVILDGNGSMDYDILYAFSHIAIHEMTLVGKELAAKFYGSEKVYSYYNGCSEGGREGLSQVQRYTGQFDGVVVGAPAMRMAFQQPLHLYSSLVELTQGYAPPPCELTKVNTDTISQCDALDGKEDGVVSRTDLCFLHHNTSQSIGESYSCPASLGAPAQTGKVTAQGASVANSIVKGIFDSQGRQVYISFRPTADFIDAQTTYNRQTGQWEVDVGGGFDAIGVQWINYFIDEVKSNTLDLSNATTDTLRDWMVQGIYKYASTLQTNNPDLEFYSQSGAKIIHYHGESDNSVPAGSSVIYQDAVRNSMYPNLSREEGYNQLHDFYRLFLVPGAAHCARSTDQPEGPFPNNLLGNIIDWVENGKAPDKLNATVPSGARQDLCLWPTRPQWSSNTSTTPECVSIDDESLSTWLPDLSSIPVPVW